MKLLNKRNISVTMAVIALVVAATFPQSCKLNIDKVIGNFSVLPNFSVKLDDGRNVNLLMMYGIPGIVATFDNSSGSIKALNVLQGAYDKYGKKMTFVLIADSLDEDKVESIWKKHGFSMPYSPQDDDAVAREFSDVTPYIAVVDKELGIVAEYGGKAVPTVSELNSIIESMFK